MHFRSWIVTGCVALAWMAGVAVAQAPDPLIAHADYSNPALWLCRPDLADNRCKVDLRATVIQANGRTSIERFRPARTPKVDCFFVYPTVSFDPGWQSDFVPDHMEFDDIRLQFARYGSVCRQFAPMYRQRTLTALRAASGGPQPVGERPPPGIGGLADVIDAWNYYLRHENHGRGVVLVGHSQGAWMLSGLIAAEIEGKPAQKQIVSAILLGAPILVPPGADVGGTFKSLPLCRSERQTGCVIAYASFRDRHPPPDNSLFGKSRDGLQAACTNPANLAGGQGEPESYFLTQGFLNGAGGKTQPDWLTPHRDIVTPFVKTPGLLTTTCVQHGDFSYLEVRVNADPGDPRTDDLAGQVIRAAGPDYSWGLHIIDMDLSMGDLIRIVGKQARAYSSGKVAAPAAPATSAAGSAPDTTPALPSAINPEAAGFDSSRLKRLDDHMAKLVADGEVAGIATLLARHGKVVALNTYGKASLETGAPVREDTIFRIYSMTKPVTGVAMMILFEEGKWRLEDPVTLYVPEFKDLRVVKSVNADGSMVLEDMKRPPTMRELLSHMAGFGYGLWDQNPVDRLYREKQVLTAGSLQEMIERTAAIPLKFQPGTNWAYSNAGEIQGYIVERLSGQAFGEFLAERIFRPLGMTDTAFFVAPEKAGRLAAVYDFDKEQGKLVEASTLFSMDMPDYTRPPAMESGGGGLVSTTMDFARFAQMIANNGELDGVRILAPATVELMGTNMIPRSILAPGDGSAVSLFSDGVGYGLDVLVMMDARAAGTLGGDGTMSWGGAAGTWFWVDPANDLIFVGMLQRMGLIGRDSVGILARTLTYQALTHPER